MGGSQSSQTRTASFENNEPIGVIDVSDDVVQRLKQGIAKREELNYAPGVMVNVPPQQNIPSSSPIQAAKSPAVYYNEPSITSMQVKRDKEAELKLNDIYWNKRLTALEENLKKTNQIMEKEYEDAIEDVKQRFAFTRNPQEVDKAPFQDLRKKVIECYKVNPNQSLLCADEVNNFTDSVNLHRIKLLEDKTQEGQPILSRMGNVNAAASSIASNSFATAPDTDSAQVKEKPKCKACCACPETKKIRDACIMEKGEENCGDMIEKHKQCMRDMGFNI